jgi:subtilisin family serine protease
MLLALSAPVVAARPSVAAASTSGPAERLVVRLAGGARAASVAAAASGHISAIAPGDRMVLTVPRARAAAVLAGLRSDPRVAYATPEHVWRAADVTPNDPCFTVCTDPSVVGKTQANLRAVRAPAAWSVTQGSAAIQVAVLDTGVDATHPDLMGKAAIGPVLCSNSGQPCTPVNAAGSDDVDGHGTHVTGIIAAATNNGAGIASLGWNTSATSFKVLGDGGAGSTFDIATGIVDAVNAGFRILNLSLAGPSCRVDPTDCGPDPDTAFAVAYAEAHGALVVIAAGNDGFGDITYPAGYPGVVSVAAADNNGAVVSSFPTAPGQGSEFGPWVSISAPGVGIVSTWKDGHYFVDEGTSMSVPHVSAAAALLLSAFPQLSGPQLATRLIDTAAPSAGGPPIGGGFLDVYAALTAPLPGRGVNGYAITGADAKVAAFGFDPFEGTLGNTQLNQPVVGMTATANRLGYWLVASDGGIFTFGQAGFFGSTGGLRLNKPVVGMASTPNGGYWLVASDGGIFTFGPGAAFYGSTGGLPLNKPVVAMAATPSGHGYWLVASDGGIFTFGDAAFYGSTGGLPLNKPVVSMAASPTGHGYWLVASDGGIFTFGDAAFRGSTGGLPLNKPVEGMAASPSGHGYWLVGSDGGIFTFGDARFYGSSGNVQLNAPVVAIAS